MEDRDYFSEEIGSEDQTPVKDYFSEELIKNKPENAGNVLERAAKAAMSSINPTMIGNMARSGTMPGQIGLGLGAMATGRDFTEGTDVGVQADAKRTGAIDKAIDPQEHPFLNIGADIASSPDTLVGLGMGGVKAVKGIGSVAKKTAGWFAEPWQNTSKISKLKTSKIQDIENVASSELSEANKLGSMKKQVAGKLYGDEPSSSLVSEKSYLQKGIEKSSDKEALKLQKDLPELYGRKSDEFGEGLNKLVGDKPIPVEVSKIQPQLEKSLLDHGILRFDETGNIVPSRAPLGPKETKVYNMYRNFKQGLIDNPDISVDASDLLKSQSSMKVPWGKKFSGEDMLMSRVKQNVSSALEDVVPGLKDFRSSHAPFLKGKYQSIKELNPFSNEYSTKKAAGFLERYAKNEPGKFEPDEKRLVAFLERELGNEINSSGKVFGNRLQQSAARKKVIETRLSEELGRIDRTIEDAKSAIGSKKAQSTKELEDIIDESIRKNNWDKWKRKGAGIGIGALLSNTVLKKVSNWYSGKPND